MTTTIKISRFCVALALSAFLLFGAMPLSTFAKSDSGKGAPTLSRFGARNSTHRPNRVAKPASGRARKSAHPPARKK